MELPQAETKQPSNETKTTSTTTGPDTYLSSHLLVPYFTTPEGQTKRPEHLIAWWSRIFSFLLPDERDRLHLRFLCRLFRDALKPPPIWTTFPHSKQDPSWSSSLATLMKHLNALSKIKMNTVPTVLFVEEGVHKSKEQRVCIEYPIKMIGAGPDKTILQGTKSLRFCHCSSPGY